MHRSQRFQVCAVFLIEIVQIGLVLKEVGVQLSTLQRLVGQDVVGELLDLQLNALLFQNGRRLLENLPVGRWWSPPPTG